MAAELAGARCVAADSAAALVVADVLTRDLRDGCPVVVDVTGLTYDQDRGDLAVRADAPRPGARTPSGSARSTATWPGRAPCCSTSGAATGSTPRC